MTRVKDSTLAGRWYAADPTTLRDEIDRLLAAEPPALRTPVQAVIVPHAAYQYSGRAAAAGYACVAGAAYSTVVILAPSHYCSFRGVAMPDVDAFATPLGRVAIDHERVAALQREPHVCVRSDAYEEEHSLEIQLPFVQRVLPQVRLVPILVGDMTDADYEAIGTVLRALVDEHTLFVVSSDFVHYGQRFRYLPFPSDTVESVRVGLRELDMGAISRVCDGDTAAFRHYVSTTGATICGRNPIALFLTVAAGGLPGQLLAYYTSLDVTGDHEHSVSYAAIAFPRPQS